MTEPRHIFLSYKSEEGAYAIRMRDVLESMGYKVWWDRRIQTGQAWHQEIDTQLRKAACVIVLWSRRAVESKWVGHEAAHAMARDVFAPCRIEFVDIPAPFNRNQAANLVGWTGRIGTAEFPNLFARVKELMGPPKSDATSLDIDLQPWPSTVPRPFPDRIASWSKSNSMAILVTSVALSAVGTVYYLLNAQIATLQNLTDNLSRSLASATAQIEESSKFLAMLDAQTRKLEALSEKQSVEFGKANDELREQQFKLEFSIERLLKEQSKLYSDLSVKQ